MTVKHAGFWLSALTLPTVTAVLILLGHWNDQKAAQIAALNAQNEALAVRSALCARKAANFASVLDRRLYSEESAQRIYTLCLEEKP